MTDLIDMRPAQNFLRLIMDELQTDRLILERIDENGLLIRNSESVAADKTKPYMTFPISISEIQGKRQ